jgi:hypothetical protein
MRSQPITMDEARTLAYEHAVAVQPMVAGHQPKVTPRHWYLPDTTHGLGVLPAAAPRRGVVPNEYVFTFQATQPTPDGFDVTVRVRVTVNLNAGTVLNVTASK